MGARTKLNEIQLLIATGIATSLGLATSSWLVFAICLGTLVAIKLHSGSIRTRRKRGR
jgi:hypothetical protein